MSDSLTSEEAGASADNEWLQHTQSPCAIVLSWSGTTMNYRALGNKMALLSALLGQSAASYYELSTSGHQLKWAGQHAFTLRTTLPKEVAFAFIANVRQHFPDCMVLVDGVMLPEPTTTTKPTRGRQN